MFLHGLLINHLCVYDDDDDVLTMTSEYRCATKCYVLFVEVATRKGCDVILTDDCKSKVQVHEV